MELRVGQRVKVVAPDPHGGDAAYKFVGRLGTIRKHTKSAMAVYDWWVDIDGDEDSPWPFTSQELAPLDESTITITVDITTYRGFHTTKVVSIDPGICWADRASYELQRIEREVADEMDDAS